MQSASAPAIELRFHCGCGRMIKTLAVAEDWSLRSVDYLTPAGPSGVDGEDRWRIPCTAKRCSSSSQGATRTVKGDTVLRIANRKADAGQIRTVRRKGQVDVKVVDLRFGEDL